ncbi:MAG: carboxymuconolactone decarboxylase family protein [Alphaproteobacteria bacterium]
MARIPYYDPATAPEELRKALDQLPAGLNVFKMLANAETLFPSWARLGGAILGKMKLSPKLRELVILRIARISDCEYEWTQHVPIGKAVGVTDAQVEALLAGRDDAPCFDESERLVLRATDESTRDVRLSQATFDALLARFDRREIVEILMTAGFYRALATVLESTAVDPDPPAGAEIAGEIARRLEAFPRGR